MRAGKNGRRRVVDRHNDNRELFSVEPNEVHGDGKVLHAAERAYVQEAAAPKHHQQSYQANHDARKAQQGHEITIGTLNAPQIPVGARQAIAQYPLLEGLLAQKALPLRGVWSLRDVAKVFDVSVRTIQDWIRDGKLMRRDLPGRGRFLSEDLETFLQDSLKKPVRKSED